jgi:hypothetical protein
MVIPRRHAVKTASPSAPSSGTPGKGWAEGFNQKCLPRFAGISILIAYPTSVRERIFLLSPARCSGERANLIYSERAKFPLALRLRSGDATLAETFTFLSGLYFRGKLAYANRFARPDCVWIMTTNQGLLAPHTPLNLKQLRRMAKVPIALDEPRYTRPLKRCARQLAEESDAEIVLLGSVASGKYVDLLLAIFGDRLKFPAQFVGRGDMSRGGLMLRAADSGQELDYIPVAGAIRHGKRPPRLLPIQRNAPQLQIANRKLQIRPNPGPSATSDSCI